MKENKDVKAKESIFINAKESDGAEIVIVFSVLNGQNGYGREKRSRERNWKKRKGEQGGCKANTAEGRKKGRKGTGKS